MLELYTSKDDWRNLPHGGIKTTIMAGNGIFELQNGWLGSSLKKVNDYATVIYPKLEEELVIKNEKKTPVIPKEAILYVIKWYSSITNKNGEEAQINFYYTKGKDSITVKGEEKKLKEISGVHFWTDDVFSYTPLQYNSGTLTEVEDEIYTEINKQIGFYVETHSHNSMGAFASGTDLANSKNEAIQLVFGKLDTNEVEMHSWATVCGLTREKVTPEEMSLYVELPEYTLKENEKYYISKTEVDSLEYSEDLLKEWSNQIKIRSTRTYTKGKSSYTSYWEKIYGDKSNKKSKVRGQYSLFDDGEYDWSKYYDRGGYSSYSSGYETFESRLADIGDNAKAVFSSINSSKGEAIFELTSADIIDVFIAGANIAKYSSKTDDEILSNIYDVIDILIEEEKVVSK